MTPEALRATAVKLTNSLGIPFYIFATARSRRPAPASASIPHFRHTRRATGGSRSLQQPSGDGTLTPHPGASQRDRREHPEAVASRDAP